MSDRNQQPEDLSIDAAESQDEKNAATGDAIASDDPIIVGIGASAGRLAITVSDDGRGSNQDIVKNPTEPGGFGLPSLKERARSIGGDLSFESAPEKGSRFTLIVPFHLHKTGTAASVETTADRHDSSGGERLETSDMAGTRVLFADDHQVMRQGLIRLVTGQPGIHVVGEAANGRQALELARHFRPEVVVMDVSMPEMDGIEATRRIKAELPEIRVIGLSMHDDEQIVRMMQEAGAEAFISKTASSAELLKVIYQLADRNLSGS